MRLLDCTVISGPLLELANFLLCFVYVCLCFAGSLCVRGRPYAVTMISESSSEPKRSDALPSPSATPGPGMPDSRTRSEGETPRYSRGRLSRGKGLRKTTGW
jgi:hypothetical protein